MSTLTARRHPILPLVPVVLTQRVVFALTVASIVFHQVCSIGAVVAGAVIVGQVASKIGGVPPDPLTGAGPRCGSRTTWPTGCLIDFRVRVYDGVEPTAPGGCSTGAPATWPTAPCPTSRPSSGSTRTRSATSSPQ